MTPGDITERMFQALCVQLMRAGKLDTKDVIAASDEMAAKGDEEGAYGLQCFIVEAQAPGMVEWHAERTARMALERAQYAAPKKPEGYKPDE